MLEIVWSDEAGSDVVEIVSYIARRNPAAARRMRSLITNAVLPTSEHPYLFSPGRVPGTREIVAHPNYIIVYRVGNGMIDVLRVLHSRMEYP